MTKERLTHPWNWTLPLLVLLAFVAMDGSTAHAASSKRCLHHRDCAKGFQCLQRRCFKGLVGTVGSNATAAYKLAIPKVRWFGAPSPHAAKLQRNIWQLVHHNFSTLPGSFNLLNKSSFLERPPYNGVDIGTFYFKPWQSIKTNGLIKIGVRKGKGKEFTLMFRYYDVDETKMIVRANQTVSLKHYRWALHKLCDKVYKYLTNKPGIFATLITYVKRNRKGGKDIWVSDFDGQNQRRVISNGKINVLPRWAPNGQSIVFTSYLTGGAYLYRLNLATKRVTRISKRPGTYTGATLSPKGGRLAFAMTARNSNQASDIYVSKPNGTGAKRLTTSWGIDVTPSWSPDGKRLAFVSERFASPQIFFMNADGSSQTRLTFKGNYNQEPRWSPRGNEIMFTARDEFLQYDLFVIRLDKDASGQLKPAYRRLTQNQGSNLEATWSPDGRYILYISTRVGERKLYIMSPNGDHQKLFIRGWGSYATPDWSNLMKNPSVPVQRNYYAGVRYVGYKKDVVGNYIKTKEMPKTTPRPTPRKPNARKPTPRKPNVRKPAARKPDARKPDARKPDVRKPVARKPDTGKPATRKPAVTPRRAAPKKPDARKPDARKPDARKPDARKPDARKPAARKPAARKPAARKPAAKRPTPKTPENRNQPPKRREGETPD